MGKYATVVIDPPWDSGGILGAARLDESIDMAHEEHPYDVMSLEDIATLPVLDVCQDDAWVFLWTTSGMMPFAYPLMGQWGIPYKFTMTWHKPNGPKPYRYPTYNAEFIVVGKLGHASFTEWTGFYTANCWDAPRNFNTDGWGRQVDSGAKPEGFYDLLRRVTPGPRLDIFGRRRIAGL